MSAKFQDYYKTLGISRNADAEEIKKAYRKMARKYHPDVNKDKDAEDTFKQVSEAHEVLKDPNKRELYDQLGANWKTGQEFKPNPEWQQAHYRNAGNAGGAEFHFSGGDFSEFFENLFGGGRFRSAGGDGGFRQSFSMPGQDHEAQIEISLEEAFSGTTRNLSLQSMVVDENGHAKPQTNTFQVKVPTGVTDGTRIRMAGKGGDGIGGGKPGNLYLKIRIQPHNRFQIDGHDLLLDLPITPWEAALGANITVSLLDGDIQLKIPELTQTGKKIRLKEKGLPRKGGSRGNLIVRLKIVNPVSLSEREKALFSEMAAASTYDPRKN